MSSNLRRVANITVGGAQLGLRFDQAQFIRTEGGVGVWLVKGNKVACIFEAESVVGACNTGLDIARNGLILVTSREYPPRGQLPEHFLGVGIAPNWAKAVRLRVGPQREIIPVANNVYSLQARDPINLEELIGSAAQHAAQRPAQDVPARRADLALPPIVSLRVPPRRRRPPRLPSPLRVQPRR